MINQGATAPKVNIFTRALLPRKFLPIYYLKQKVPKSARKKHTKVPEMQKRRQKVQVSKRWDFIVLVLLSAHTKRVSVSRMRDCLLNGGKILKPLVTSFTNIWSKFKSTQGQLHEIMIKNLTCSFQGNQNSHFASTTNFINT